MVLRKKETAPDEKKAGAPGAYEEATEDAMPDYATVGRTITDEEVASQPEAGVKIALPESEVTEKTIREAIPKKETVEREIEKAAQFDKVPQRTAPVNTLTTVKTGGEVTTTGRPVMVAALDNFADALPPIDFGVLPRLLASNGAILDSDNVVVGKVVVLKIASFNKNFVVTPGEDGDAARALVRFSHDGQIIDGTGESINQYIADMKEAGYERACIKEYCDLIGILVTVDDASDHELVDSMVQVQLAPQSRKQFEGYRLQGTVKVSMGRMLEEALSTIEITAVPKTMNNNNFTMFKFKTATVAA